MFSSFPQNRRHNSLFNPNSDKQSLLSQTQSSLGASTNASFNYSKLPLRSNSIFAYQASDHFSNIFEGFQPQLLDNTNSTSSHSLFQSIYTNPNKIKETFPTDNGEDEETPIEDSFSESSLSSECSPLPQKKLNRLKRFSDGSVFSTTAFRPHLLALNMEKYTQQQQQQQQTMINHHQCPQQCPHLLYNNTNNNNNNANGSSSSSNAQGFHHHQQQQQQQQDYRRNSLGMPVPFNFTINTLQHNKIMTFLMNSNNSPYAFQFKQKKNLNNDQYVLENLSTLLRDHAKCWEVQAKLDEKKNDIPFIKLFYELLENTIIDVINHQYGNYGIQKLFEIFIYQKNFQLITKFFTKIQPSLFIISVNNFGTRVLQRAIELMNNGVYELISTPQLDSIFKCLVDKHIFPLCNDQNGNHVLQKIIIMFPKNKNDFIYYKLNQYAIDISRIKQGVSILQTSLENATTDQRRYLIGNILNDIGSVIDDEFGNYVIQFIVSLGDKEFNNVIYEYIIKNVVTLSKNKYSSNVIEKCIIPNDPHSEKLLTYLGDNKVIREMIMDKYGNYVVQKALNVTDGRVFLRIIHQIQTAMSALKRDNLGKKIYDKLMGKYGAFFQSGSHTHTNNNNNSNSNTNNNTNNGNSNSNNSSCNENKVNSGNCAIEDKH